MVTVRRVGADEVAAAGETIARAFQDDPGLSWAAPVAARRHRFGPRYFALLIRKIYMPKGHVYTTDDGGAVAMWAPPGEWKTSNTQALPLFPVMLRTAGSTLPRAMSMLAMMEKRHAQQEEPHWYLPFIGTRPELQGKGHGTALLADMLGRADDEGVPAYLEASSVKNQALYHRHGFEPLGELHWPKGGPPWWPMWRAPR